MVTTVVSHWLFYFLWWYIALCTNVTDKNNPERNWSYLFSKLENWKGYKCPSYRLKSGCIAWLRHHFTMLLSQLASYFTFCHTNSCHPIDSSTIVTSSKVDLQKDVIHTQKQKKPSRYKSVYLFTMNSVKKLWNSKLWPRQQIKKCKQLSRSFFLLYMFHYFVHVIFKATINNNS